ncbi:glycosyltransferase [bacterium]|nr:glycosyltransferase [bacterium]
MCCAALNWSSIMASRIELSIVTIHRSDADALMRLRASLSRQTYPHHSFEWIVVDDASPEGPPDTVLAGSSDFSIKRAFYASHGGRAVSRNRGWKKARGALAAFVDADVELPSMWVEMMVRAVEQTGGAVVSRLLPHPSLPETAYQRYYHSRGGAKLTSGSRIPGKYFTTGAVMLPKQCLDQVSGFDESFAGWGGEDLDLGLRLERAACPIHFEGRVAGYHYHDRRWVDVEEMYRQYGASVVPLLTERYPEAEKLLSLHRLFRPAEAGGVSNAVRNTLIRAFMKKSLYRTIRALVAFFPRLAWPDPVFDYMIFFLYSRAWFEQRERGRA